MESDKTSYFEDGWKKIQTQIQNAIKASPGTNSSFYKFPASLTSLTHRKAETWSLNAGK